MEYHELSQFGIPESVIFSYVNEGLKKLFPWQIECLRLHGVADGSSNLVYSAPTGAGKTLVTEILMIKQVLKKGKKAMFIQPFVSVAREKMFALKDLFEGTGLKIDGFISGHRPAGGVSSVDIIVCTIEKANNIVNRLIESNKLDQFCFVAVDEIHMVSDSNRGYLLELLLSKLMFANKKHNDLQIVGMSATVPNLPSLATWLNAQVYETEFRPVPLKRAAMIEGRMFDENLRLIDFNLPGYNFENDDEFITSLSYQTICKGHCVLIFCPTKAWCEKLAVTIAKNFYHYHLKNKCPPVLASKTERLYEIFMQLKRTPSGLDDVLKLTIPYGVAYHHAGLTVEERDLIETGFKDLSISVLVATSTLSSGVNLPARRVIIRTPIFHGKPIDLRMYHQMSGRAGRKGKDDVGESLLVCKTHQQKIAHNIMIGDLPHVESCLFHISDKDTLTSSLKRLILEVIGNGLVTSVNDILEYMKCTLYFSLQSSSWEDDENLDLVAMVHRCIKWLVDKEFIYLQSTQQKEEKVTPTQLGRAALLSSLPTAEALLVLADLQNASKAFALDSELHLVYQVTPIFIINQMARIDWFNFIRIFEALSPAHKNASKLIGIKESFLIKMASTGGELSRKSEKQQRLLNVHVRFYAALILNDLINELQLDEVCAKYECSKGTVQNIQQSSATFSGMVTTFCQELGWWSLEILLKNFQARLIFGIQHELLDLSRIYLLDNVRARAFYKYELKTCFDVALSKPEEIESILVNSTKFQSKNDAHNEVKLEQEKIKIVGLNRVLSVSQAAQEILKEARRVCLQNGELTSGENDSLVDISTNGSRSISYTSPAAKSQKMSLSFQENLNPSQHNKLAELTHTKANEISMLVNSTPYKRTPINSKSLLETPSKATQQETTPETNCSMSNSQIAAFFAADATFSMPEETLSPMPLPCKESTPLSNSKNRSKSFTNNNISQQSRNTVPSLNDNSLDLFDATRDDCDSEIKSKQSSALFSTDVNDSTLLSLESLSLLESEHSNDSLEDISFHKQLREQGGLIDVTDSFDDFCKRLHVESRVAIKFDSCVEVLCFSWCSNQVHYLDLRSLNPEKRKMYKKKLCSEMGKLTESITLVGYQLKDQLKILFGERSDRMLTMKCQFFDMRLACWMLDPDANADKSHNKLVQDFQNGTQQMFKTNSENQQLKTFLRSCQICAIYLKAFPGYYHQLKEGKLLEIFENLEMRHIMAFATMEMNGMHLNKAELKVVKIELLRALNALEKEAWRLAGRKFNLSSPNEISKILFDEIGLAVKSTNQEENTEQKLRRLRKQPKTRFRSTNKETLQQLCQASDHPLPRIIMQWRLAHHTFYQNLLPIESYMKTTTTLLFRPKHFYMTCTGRMLMGEPNIQNIPRSFNVTSNDTNFHFNLRNFFTTPKGSGRVFVSADYSQLELRIMAHYSNDANLLRIFNSEVDIFCKLAENLRNESGGDVSDEERQRAKQVCYGILYGMSPLTLAKQLSVSREESERFVADFSRKFPKLRPRLDRIVEKCRKQGYITTVCGRRRYLSGITSDKMKIRSHAERQAINTTIQGSAADIIKLATCKIVNELIKNKYRVMRHGGDEDGRCCLYVNHMHDELMFETQRSHLPHVARIIRSGMTNALDLNVKLAVKLKAGESWGALAAYDD